jgi:AhpD family alkylhydroperoxidase
MANAAKYGEEFSKAHPDVGKNLQALGEAVLKPGALDTKSKELIALGISVSGHCDECIAYHTRASIAAGATKEEVVEALGVAVLMGGGPSFAYSTHALAAMEQLKATEDQT